MAEYTQELIQRLHTILQASMAPLPADKKMDSLVVLQFPGLPIDPSEFEENGLSDSLQTILDTGVNMQPAYQPTGSSLFGLFGQILKNAQTPPGRTLSREEQQRLKIAQTYIRKNLSTYNRYYDEDLNIQMKIRLAKSKNERAEAQMERKRNDLNWDASGRRKYEAYLKTERELQMSSPAAYFMSALERYGDYPTADIQVTPQNWWCEEDKTAWTSMELVADSTAGSTSAQTISSNRTLKEFYQTPGIWGTIAGWFGIRKGVTITKELSEVVQKANEAFSSSNMRMTWEMIPVLVGRPWLDMNVLAVKEVKMAGVDYGAFSSGKLSAENKGTLPGYITAFIVAKNMEMTMSLSNDLSEMIKKNSNSITCGPVDGGNRDSISIVESERSSQKDKTNVTISAGPGKQIIGYIIRPFPCFPSA